MAQAQSGESAGDGLKRALRWTRGRVGVARAAWFPDVTLTATGGYASPELSDLFKWSSRAWGIGALLSLPLFDGGRCKAGIAVLLWAYR